MSDYPVMQDYPVLEFQVKIPQQRFFNVLALHQEEIKKYIEEEFNKIDYDKLFRDSIQKLCKDIIDREVDNMKYSYNRNYGYNSSIIKGLFDNDLEKLKEQIKLMVDNFQDYIVAPKIKFLLEEYERNRNGNQDR